jgi:23S rRNA (adenine2503-C2)-methyltransferase
MIYLTDLNAAQIAETLELAPYQGRQIFRWIHQKRVFDIHRMTDLSKALRERLAQECETLRLKVVDQEASASANGTRKSLFVLPDGETVESVVIRDGKRTTFCLSSQVGCAVKCAFCATGESGFARNLSPGEIVEQALHMIEQEQLGERTPNIVFMGMGEPFRNYEAVVAAIRLLMDRQGLNIGARKITVSTAGEIRGIQRFAEEAWQVRLSVSLHAANDDLRSSLVPLNRKYPLDRLIQSVKDYCEKTGRQATFEWTLMKGVNDSDKDARELLEIARPLKVSVNLIPMNPVPGLPFEAPAQEKCEAFAGVLQQNGVATTLRRERGSDIAAACGQLRRRNTELAGRG